MGFHPSTLKRGWVGYEPARSAKCPRGKGLEKHCLLTGHLLLVLHACGGEQLRVLMHVQDFHDKEKRCLKWPFFTSCTNVRLRTEKPFCEVGGRKHVSAAFLHTVFNKDDDLFITLPLTYGFL